MQHRRLDPNRRDPHGLRVVEHPLLWCSTERAQTRDQRADQRLRALVRRDHDLHEPGVLQPPGEEDHLTTLPVLELHPPLAEVELRELPGHALEANDRLLLRRRADRCDELIERTALALVAPRAGAAKHLDAGQALLLREQGDDALAEGLSQRGAAAPGAGAAHA